MTEGDKVDSKKRRDVTLETANKDKNFKERERLRKGKGLEGERDDFQEERDDFQEQAWNKKNRRGRTVWNPKPQIYKSLDLNITDKFEALE